MIRHQNLTLALVLSGAALIGCVNNGADGPMRIIGNVVPEDGCLVDSTSTTFNDDGVIEASSRLGYVFTPAVINDITLVDGEVAANKTIYVTGARVDISFYDTELGEAVAADAELLEFQVPVAGTIDPGGGTSAFSFEVVPPELLAAIGARLGVVTEANPLPRTVLDVRIQMVGTKGGGEVESNVFRYPVEVCVGCLRIDQGACAMLPASFDASPGGVCNVLQDGALDCCDNYTVCPARAPGGA